MTDSHAIEDTRHPALRKAGLRRLAIGAIPLLTMLLYASWQPRNFVGWDDTNYIRDNPLLTAPDGLRRIWATFELEQYYPLTFTTYWLEYRLWGPWPTGYYTVNVGLHALNALLVFFVCRTLLTQRAKPPSAAPVAPPGFGIFGPGEFAAWLAAAFFALHPVQVASVAWLAERKNTLSGALALGCMLLYLNHARRGGAWRYGAAIFLFALALLSKTAVVLLPVSLVAAEMLILRRPLRRALLRAVPLLVLAGAAAGITYFREQAVVGNGGLPLSLRPFAAAGAFWFYAYKLLVPFPMPAIYPRWSVSGTSPLWFGALAALIVAVRLVVVWRKQLGGEITWGLAHLLLMLLPVLGLAEFGYLAYAPVGDHFLYLALIGAFVALGVLLERMPGRAANSALAGVLVVLAACGLFTVRQAGYWRDGQTLFAHTLQYNPGAVVAHQILGKNLTEAGRFVEAEREYAVAVRAQPEQPILHGEHGAALRNAGRNVEAIDELRVALELQDRRPAVLLNYGGALADLGRLEESEAMMRRGSAAAPGSVRAHRELADVLARRQKPAEAEREFRAALQIDAADPAALAAYAEALSGWLRGGEALDMAQRGVSAARRNGDKATVERLEADIAKWR